MSPLSINIYTNQIRCIFIMVCSHFNYVISIISIVIVIQFTFI